MRSIGTRDAPLFCVKCFCSCRKNMADYSSVYRRYCSSFPAVGHQICQTGLQRLLSICKYEHIKEKEKENPDFDVCATATSLYNIFQKVWSSRIWVRILQVNQLVENKRGTKLCKLVLATLQGHQVAPRDLWITFSLCIGIALKKLTESTWENEKKCSALEYVRKTCGNYIQQLRTHFCVCTHKSASSSIAATGSDMGGADESGAGRTVCLGWLDTFVQLRWACLELHLSVT